ncbi:hypothetical protein GCM10023088_13770 [Actinomadura verrucosospora]
MVPVSFWNRYTVRDWPSTTICPSWPTVAVLIVPPGAPPAPPVGVAEVGGAVVGEDGGDVVGGEVGGDVVGWDEVLDPPPHPATADATTAAAPTASGAIRARRRRRTTAGSDERPPAG